MRTVKRAFWAALALLAALWLASDPRVFAAQGFFPLRGSMVQATGVLAMGCMSLAMILALRPRWPERRLGGLDKMYRLHKWLGIGALVLASVHWLWAKGPKWAVDLGWLERPMRGPQGGPENPVAQTLRSLREPAEILGEWAFYAAVLLIAVALIQSVPYRLFYKTHRLLAAVYLVLVFHTVVLMRFASWATPLGLVMAALLGYGTYAAIVVLFRRVGAARRVRGRIVELHRYPGVHAIEAAIDLPKGWPGHKAGQFAFATADAAEGPHPFTIASAWSETDRRITFIAKELGDYTRKLAQTLKVGQEVLVEGPYGCFTFDDDRPRHQIWVGGGIGITPFVARMKHLAELRRREPTGTDRREVHLFHTTAEHDAEALGKLAADAAAAGVHLHLLIDARDGRLSGERIRELVPHWREASLWFCGPGGFGAALRQDFAAQSFPVEARFHQELFAMR
ncbi:MAG: ferric reductase-like transmembrane domain-containing protein [Rhodospirillales bacterium]|jgi:predicted ferric reductase|nr:ferric reductase-like transmembrane domain-containing protein [Rhodospirillales bacterium]